MARGDYATLFSELEGVKAERDALAVENAALKGVVGEINEELYDKGFEVAGWHLNGDLEPLDNWFTDNGWGVQKPQSLTPPLPLSKRGEWRSQ